MPRKTIARRTAVVVVTLALMAGACGADDGAGQSDDAHTDHVAGDHAAIEIGEDVVAPRIAIEVTEDPVEGWNLAVMLSDFRLAPENVSGPHVDGEGHMHLYIDGRKVSRIYSQWHHIKSLEAGQREIRVELTANDHSPLTMNGDTIEAVNTVLVGESRSHEMGHAGNQERVATEPRPSLSLGIVEDPAGGWNLHAVPENFRLAPENVSGSHVDGEGHMHLYIDGQKAARLYDTWYQLPPLEAGTHEVRVDLRSNDHALLTVEGVAIDAVATLEVSHEQATAHAVDGGSAQDAEAGGHTHDGTTGHGRANGAEFAADVADADQTVALQIVNGELVDGFRRVRVAVGSVVAWSVTADVTDEIHIHGYDILQPVADGQPASFAFAAEIPGVFEVELEASGQLLLLLEVS